MTEELTNTNTNTNTDIKTIFSRLPIEIINIIINYTNVVVFRHGKYIDRIKTDDERYNIISNRIPPRVATNNLQKVRFVFEKETETKYYILEQRYDTRDKKWYLRVKTICNLHDDIVRITNVDRYMYSNFGTCNKMVFYEM